MFFRCRRVSWVRLCYRGWTISVLCSANRPASCFSFPLPLSSSTFVVSYTSISILSFIFFIAFALVLLLLRCTSHHACTHYIQHPVSISHLHLVSTNTRNYPSWRPSRSLHSLFVSRQLTPQDNFTSRSHVYTFSRMSYLNLASLLPFCLLPCFHPPCPSSLLLRSSSLVLALVSANPSVPSNTS